MDKTTATLDEAAWRSLYRIGAGAALLMLLLIPVQTVVFFVSPPPQTVEGFFTLFQRSKLLGLLSLDLIYMVDILLAGVLILVLCVALRKISPTLVAIALFINVLATAIYFSSNTSFEMLTLSGQHAAATSETQRAGLMSAGEAMLTIYKGTAFNVSYVLAAVGGLVVAALMLRSDVFGRRTAYLGLLTNTLGLIPSTAGTVGLVAAFLFLIPFMIWLVLILRRLMQLGRDGRRDAISRAHAPSPGQPWWDPRTPGPV
jgi:hypothetical protein